MTASSLSDRILEMAAAEGTSGAAALAREAGSREALEVARADLQEQIRRTAGPEHLKALRLVSAALETLPRDQNFGFFNNGKKTTRE